ncbi:MAG: hypothetical protein GXX84_01135 [Acidobacteria bacterium]|nr:hypothetical protein [Acidobacteriota bacterium]
MEQKFASFVEACSYKVNEKQHHCGDCRYFISEEQFTDAPTNWGTCPHHSHAFIKYRRACYSFESK